MSKRSRNESSGTTRKPRDLARALPAALLREAHELAAQYAVVLEPDEDVGFRGTCLELPTVFAHASTPAKCVRELREVLAIAVAVMLERDQVPPAPSSENRRSTQVNIRLTPREKAVLERVAKQRGFRGLSDFIRNAALSQTRRSA